MALSQTGAFARPNHPSIRIPGLVALSGVSPSIAARIALTIFSIPRRYRQNSDERAFLAQGSPISVHAAGRELAAWRWGSGPAVLLVHGWSGCAAQFHLLAKTILSAGFSVVAFDQPGHGRNPGTTSNLLRFNLALQAINRLHGPFHSVIAHSLGSLSAAMVAADQVLSEKLVLINPIPSVAFAVESFSSVINLPQEVSGRLGKSIEKRFGIVPDETSFENLIGAIEAETLVLHEKNDRQIPWEHTRAWASNWCNAIFETTEGTGHQRILSDAGVISRVVSFLGVPRSDIRAQVLSDYAL